MRRTELARSTVPLKRTAQLNRTPMKRGKSQKLKDYEAELDAITPALKRRSGGRCEICIPGVCLGPRAKEMSRHHRLPRGQGGPNVLGNLIHACGSGTTGCHGHIEHYRDDAKKKGWLLPMGSTDFTLPFLSYRK